MVKNPPADAGGTGSIPGAGSPGPATSEAHAPRACAPHEEKPPQRGDCRPQQERPPRATARRSPQQQQRPGSAENKVINRLKNRRQAAGRTQTVRVNNTGQGRDTKRYKRVIMTNCQ